MDGRVVFEDFCINSLPNVYKILKWKKYILNKNKLWLQIFSTSCVFFFQNAL